MENVNVFVNGYTGNGDNQYKTVYLKANMPFAEQVANSNTKYVVKWNFDLNGERVDIPEHCIIQFDGGLVDNGILALLNDTLILATEDAFGNNISFENGRHIEWNILWFGAKCANNSKNYIRERYKSNIKKYESDPPDGDAFNDYIPEDERTDISITIQRMVNAGCFDIFIPKGSYYWTNTVECKTNLRLHGNFDTGEPYEDPVLEDESGYREDLVMERDSIFFPLELNNAGRGVDDGKLVLLIVGGVVNGKNNKKVVRYTTLNMYGLSFTGAWANKVSILGGHLGYSEIYGNKIRNCGYFIRTYAKPWRTEAYCAQNNLVYDINIEKPRSGLYKVSSIHNNYILAVTKSCFQCGIADSSIYSNYFNASPLVREWNGTKYTGVFGNSKFFDGKRRDSIVNTRIFNNYIDYFYIVYDLNNGCYINSSNNIYDLPSKVFTCTGVLTGIDGNELYTLKHSICPTITSIGDSFSNINNAVWNRIQLIPNGISELQYRDKFFTDGGEESGNPISPYSYSRSTRAFAAGIDYNNPQYDEARFRIITQDIPLPEKYIVNGEWTGYYELDTYFSIFGDFIGHQTIFIPQRLSYVDKIFQGRTWNFSGDIPNENRLIRFVEIIGVPEKYFEFDNIYLGTYKTSINISSLDNIVVDKLPTTKLYSGRKVIYNGYTYTYNNGVWKSTEVSLNNITNVTNDIVNNYIKKDDFIVTSLPTLNLYEGKKVIYNNNKYIYTNSQWNINNNITIGSLIAAKNSSNNYIWKKYVENSIYSLPVIPTLPPYSKLVSMNCYNNKYINNILINDGSKFPGSSILLEEDCIYNLIPNREYSSNIVYIDNNGNLLNKYIPSFTTYGEVRLIRIDGVKNTRDIGGWKCTNGKTVKYGRIFRGGSLTNIQTKGRTILTSLLNVQKIITLNDDSINIAGISNIQIPFSTLVVPTELQFPKIRRVFKEILAILETNTNINNYPNAVYIHCTEGRDRTGTIIIILLGVLGVTENNILKDYDLSFYFTDSEQFNGFTIINGIKNPDETLLNACRRILIGETDDLLNVTDSDINSFIGLMTI